ncbi:hypothetical protein EX895_001097 [Sporisorium graminicola]|uniref:Phospholipid/glycerol acyltransferase domain-containing protein n=1 Tax=Sporisorium graminicola TaxID=280036 RepID=A0A4U7KZ09_9BASI|nr:hypothetical protein EX895_001097 [Sporisorium graminicola]TKY89800.1 hypothetical protein EX895_001097 [Sporisorium graminicola]
MAEKFSKFRDPGTGIQVFLTPVVASSSSSGLASILLPLFAALGVVRAIVGGTSWGLYLLFGWKGFLRVVLFALGFVRLAVDEVSSGSGKRRETTSAVGAGGNGGGKGEVVLANHSSWIDLLVLSYLYPGIQFVVPVIEESTMAASTSTSESGAKKRGTPKANAMSANTRIATPTASTSGTNTTAPAILGYTILTLPSALRFIGALPPTRTALPAGTTHIHATLSATLSSTTAPLAFFPELVTSNNRALLHITTLPRTSPTLARCHITTLKYSPPTRTSISSVYTVGHPTGSIYTHLAQILFTSSPARGVSLKHSDLSAGEGGEAWADQVVASMSNMARLKQTSIDWWSKREFLTMVRARSKRA